jgi:hypothetical protein
VLFPSICIYYNPNWFISSSPLHSLVHFLWWPRPVKILNSSLCSEHISHFPVFGFLSLPYPSHAREG